MNFWRKPILVQLTLLSFTAMLLYNPAHAEQLPLTVSTGVSVHQDQIPIAYVDESEVDQLIWQLQSKGYVVKEGTLTQLEQLVQADDTEKTIDEPAEEEDNGKDHDKYLDQNNEKDKGKDVKDQPCEEQIEPREQKESQQQENARQQEKSEAQAGDKKDAENPPEENKVDCNKEEKDKDKGKDKADADADADAAQQGKNNNSSPETTPESEPESSQPPLSSQQPTATEPEPEPEPSEPPPPPTTTVQPSVSVNADVSYGTQGGSSDAAKVFFLLIGFVVVAAFIVYAGKYAYDIASGKDQKLWWEIIFNSTFMDTEPRQHGHFLGAKIATGFVSNELIQLALVGEVGNADVNLVLNEYVYPQVLNFSASYWMLGGAARMHLTDKMVNASYLYMELLGGTTANPATDTIGAARFGASFGINDNVRLGASIGAQYIGLNEDQGFVNDGDDYWFTLGLEIGARF